MLQERPVERIKTTLCAVVAGAVLLAAASAVGAAAQGIAAGSPDGAVAPGKFWVFFTDKGVERADEAVRAFEAELSSRALWRRAKVGKAVDLNDLPVAGEYVEAVTATGAVVVTRSRWLNAVSVLADEEELRTVTELPCVREVRPVARATKRRFTAAPAPEEGRVQRGRTFDYGESHGQLEQVQIPDLHDFGFDGSGVVIAMLDTGFDIDHQAYRHLDVIGERDFINDDGETANEPGDPDGQDSHGTATLSCVGAAYPGEIYGGSYNASFILCKTEMVDDEIEIEEDYWVEAVEYSDSLGADLISSSLGYFYWYTYEDMDGNTAVTTIAADMAAARGIVVATSMGNEGGSDWLYMIAPADGDSVIGVGAVDIAGDRVWFSSVGPTYDGRIKPNVMALGLEAYVATTSDTNSYTHSSGTSFSCPITAGAIGLLLQGHPDWTPQDVIDALQSTATQSASPDTLMGWGIVQAFDAMYSEPLAVEPDVSVQVCAVRAYPNPASGGARIEYAVPVPAEVRIRVYDVAGRLVRTLVERERGVGAYAAAWDGDDVLGRPVANGVYFVRLEVGRGTTTAKVAIVR
jgi:subtilisin family serine protease